MSIELSEAIVRIKKQFPSMSWIDINNFKLGFLAAREIYSTMKPSDFSSINPSNSVLKKMEAEIVAQNVMKILARTGNIFRLLSWEEYEAERRKDKNFSTSEKYYFDKVIDYCTSEYSAKLFSEYWKLQPKETE